MENINGKFCINCQNLLVSQVIDNTLIFRCPSCNTVRNATDVDTLRYEEKKGEGIALFATILKTLTKDGLNPKVKVNCPAKCGGKFARQARLGKNMQIVRGCIKCGYQWDRVE